MSAQTLLSLLLAAMCLGSAWATRGGRFLAEGPVAEFEAPTFLPTVSIESEIPAVESSHDGPRATLSVPAVEASNGPSETLSASDPAAWLTSTARFKGDGTAYSDAVNGTGKAFACSFRSLNPTFSRYFAAINIHQWEEGAACGRCALARCVDDRCKVKNEDVLVQIVDQCPACKKGDLDFSFPAYGEVTGLWPHRLAIEWRWASCAPEINGTMKFSPKDGINDHWQAFYLSNARYPIKEVKLEGKALDRSQFQFFTHSGPLPANATLMITADSGATVKAVVKSFT